MDPSSSSDPNTKQEYKVEGEISHEAVTDTSSDSEENRDGNIQPENKLQQKDEYWRYTSLVKAALAGNWEIAKRFFDQDKVACTVPITKFLETALHIAVGTGKALHFVEKLVEAMPLEAITLCDDKGFTALHTAALGGNTAAAMILVKKHSALLHIRGGRDKLPIHVAAMHGHC